MNSFRCPGLPADWVNGWLAAVGTTVLDCRIRLHWTDDPVPLAVLSAKDADPVDVLANAWPTQREIEEMPLSEDWRGAGCIRRKVQVDDFVARVRAARGDPSSWTLSSTLTDLSVDKKGEVAHAPFDPAGPGSIKWLHHRLMKAHRHVEQRSCDQLRESLSGAGQRIKDNGLGFDLTRLASIADDTAKWTEPVVETLVFYGLAILPARGSGIDLRQGGASWSNEHQRGWIARPKGRGRCFVWPTWIQPLDAHGIDALLDVWKVEKPKAWPQVGVRTGWQTVRYWPKSSTSDTTRGFGSRRL